MGPTCGRYAEDYHYTNQSECTTLSGVDNAEEYKATRHAMVGGFTS
jgi:myosin heavy subunit